MRLYLVNSKTHTGNNISNFSLDEIRKYSGYPQAYFVWASNDQQFNDLVNAHLNGEANIENFNYYDLTLKGLIRANNINVGYVLLSTGWYGKLYLSCDGEQLVDIIHGSEPVSISWLNDYSLEDQKLLKSQYYGN